jgi:hypothetical protein
MIFADETWWSIALDPNHIIAELLFTIVFDGIVVWFLWGIVWKKFVFPKLRRQIHAEIDEEHGITPHDPLDHSDHDH